MNKISPRTKSGGAELRLLSEAVGFMLALLFAALAVYVSSLAYNSYISGNQYYTGTITVSGYGEISVKPDVQKLTIDIAPTPSSATSTVDYTKKILTYLKSKGIPNSDIKISTVRTLTVKLRGANITDAKIISADIEKIAAKYITPTLEDPEVENMGQLKSRALEIALNNAKLNAMRVSQSLGADLGKVMSFYDNNGGEFMLDSSDPNMVISNISVSFQTR